MEKVLKTKEMFYFQPQNHGYNPDSINEVHLIGEFNDWGRNLTPEYKLIKDKVGRWVGIFEIAEGKHPYKFLLNRNTYCPKIGHIYYATTKTPDWAKNKIWYQIFPDRFCREKDTPVKNIVSWGSQPDYYNNFGGNLSGIKSKVEYFKKLYGDMNYFAVYLNPLHLSESSNHKYWPEDFEKIDPQFGTEEDLQELIDTIHTEGGKIIIDLVYNHTGLNHFAFQDILRKGPDSKYINWYRDLPNFDHEKIHLPCLDCLEGHPENIKIEKISANEAIFNVWEGKYKFPLLNYKEGMTFDQLNSLQPYFKLISKFAKPNYSGWWGFFEIPELNTKDKEVKSNLINSAKKWLKMGVDGFRLDVPDVLNNAHEFWKEFRLEMREEALKNDKNPDDIYIVGEVWTNEGITNSFIMPNDENRPIRFDSIMNYPIREAVFNFFSGQILVPAMDRIAYDGEISVMQMDIEIHKNYAHIPFETNQVQMNCFSTHDTRRIRSALHDDIKKLKAALLMQFTLLGLPTIYYGEELGTFGWVDPDNRACMDWGKAENLENYQQEKEIFNYYKILINLRTQFKCLQESSILTLLVDNERNIYSYSRFLSETDALIITVTKQNQENEIILNFSDLPLEKIKKWQNIFNNKVYDNNCGKIIISKEDLNEAFCFGIKPVIF